MVDMNTYWPIAIALGVGTFFVRFSLMLIMDKLTVSDAVQRMLRFIPVAVLPALIAPAIFLHREGGDISFAGWERSVAAMVAVIVAYKTKNILATIASGMVTLWSLQAIF